MCCVATIAMMFWRVSFFTFLSARRALASFTLGQFLPRHSACTGHELSFKLCKLRSCYHAIGLRVGVRYQGYTIIRVRVAEPPGSSSLRDSAPPFLVVIRVK